MNDFLELTQNLIDNNNFEEEEFKPLPADNYRVTVKNVEKKTSQNGNDYVSMVLEIADGEYTNRNIWNNLFFTVKTAENTIKRIYKMAEMVDIAPKAFTDVDSIVDYCKEFIDKCFEIEYDEEAFVKVKFIKGL